MNKRRSFTPNEKLGLFNEVNGICPLCSKSLMYEKANTRQRRFDLAHIYPLNPTKKEVELLKSEDKLSVDPNDMKNIIALCESCHTQFDKPRTIQSYRKVLNIKKNHIRQTDLRANYGQYEIETEKIKLLIDALANGVGMENIDDLKLELTPIDDKFNSTMSHLLSHKIRDNIELYFSFIRKRLRDQDRLNPGTSRLIASQVRAFYDKQFQFSDNQDEIFESIVDWMKNRTGIRSTEGHEIIASFYVQSCEVF